MCFSAQVWESYRSYCRATGAKIDIREYMRIFRIRGRGERLLIPKGLEHPFLTPVDDDEREIADLIRAHRTSKATELEGKIFAQKTRLHTAERKLAAKITKSAQEDVRIATKKIAQHRQQLSDLRRNELVPSDSRIFSEHYASVLVVENGERVVKPMRYLCRPDGLPPSFDRTHPGAYNARMDNLRHFWRRQFGHSHCVVVAQRMYENVTRVDEHGKPHNVVLEFVPQGGADLFLACIWARWNDPTSDHYLLSFAAVTTEPQPEVAAAGHDRFVVPIKPEHVDAWLRPDPADLERQWAILEDRQRPYFEHRLAA